MASPNQTRLYKRLVDPEGPRISCYELGVESLRGMKTLTRIDSDNIPKAMTDLLNLFGLEDSMLFPGHVMHIDMHRNSPIKSEQEEYIAFGVLKHDDEGMRLWGFGIPFTVNRHWILGTYYGYPQCCIREHLEDVKFYRHSKNHDDPLRQKKAWMRRQNQHVNGGFLACQACLENQQVASHQQINAHRLTPTPYPTDVSSSTRWPSLLLAYYRGELKPWTIQPT